MMKYFVRGFCLCIITLSITQAQVDVYLPNVERETTDSEEYLFVTTSDLTPYEVQSFQFIIYYNKEVISITEVSTSGLSTTGNGVSAFNADTTNGKIIVGWAGASSIQGGGELVKLLVRYKNPGYSKLTFRDSVNANKFEFNSGSPSANTWDGSVTIKNSVGMNEEDNIVKSFILHQNYPNPFNPATVISYQLSAFSYVELTVYDILGKEVATLVNETKSPGKYEVEFKPDDSLPGGVYIYKLTTDRYVQSKKMIYLK